MMTDVGGSIFCLIQFSQRVAIGSRLTVNCRGPDVTSSQLEATEHADSNRGLCSTWLHGIYSHVCVRCSLPFNHALVHCPGCNELRMYTQNV